MARALLRALQADRRTLFGCLDVVVELVGFFLVWSLFVGVCGTPVPLTAVMSGSMEPMMYMGDLLFVDASYDHGGHPLKVNDVIVFQPPANGSTPVVHRIIRTTEGTIDQKGPHFVTKGDNNDKDDSHFLYDESIEQDQVLGRVRAVVPWLGFPTLAVQSGVTKALVIFLLIASHPYGSDNIVPFTERLWDRFSA